AALLAVLASSAHLGTPTAAAAPLARQLPKPTEEQEFFEVADHDGNGWIAFAEAEASLLVDRDEFAVYDADRDGRISRDEFGTRYREVVSRTGGFAPPVPPRTALSAPPRDAIQLRNAYDTDFDGAVGPTELEAMLADYVVPGMTPTLALGLADADKNGRLEMPEFQVLTELLDQYRERTAGAGRARATTLRELFGDPLERPVAPRVPPPPPLIAGPVEPFDRLDLDRDGMVRVEELRGLEFPLVLPVRANAVLASLDRDGDGAVSEAELAIAFEPPP
ncbi:MAG TPA: hypothetical protein VJP77_08975, partial [Planctomycetota bacterium]|nr:hypothetical protein [Planctomycetota bacterium]